MARLLLAEGYPLLKTDRELGFLSTDYRATANRAVLAALRFAIVPETGGSRIEARGMYRMTSGPLQAESPIVLRGMAGSPAGIAWQEMARFGALYVPATLTYRR